MPSHAPELAPTHVHLWEANSSREFWRLVQFATTEDDWRSAGHGAVGCLSGLPITMEEMDPRTILPMILGEGQFGPDHWRLSPARQAYYRVRAVLPARTRPILRRLLLARHGDRSPLHWPVEDRYVRFQFEVIRRLLESRRLDSVRYLHFWPEGRRFAFVLTHDVESSSGHDFVREVAALEERFGFRSSFNFVPELYPVDPGLLQGLRERGFEIGVHGLKHDGRLFSSRDTFSTRVRRINHYLKAWGAVGFRSPMTHRNPVWMQELEIEYDSSFFDTDPFEPIPGGTMSIWPFFVGNFVELPYSLVQDHTLTVTLGERSPRVWLEKVDFIRRYRGMALSLTHPDYLRDPHRLGIYEQFLRSMRERDDYWHALPRDVAQWWRARAKAVSGATLPGGSIGEILLAEGEVTLSMRESFSNSDTLSWR